MVGPRPFAWWSLLIGITPLCLFTTPAKPNAIFSFSFVNRLKVCGSQKCINSDKVYKNWTKLAELAM